METSIKKYNKWTDLLITVLAITSIPHLAIILADTIYPTVKAIDVDETFLYITIHHLFQLVLTILIMLFLSRNRNINHWGFNLNNYKVSLKWIGIFTLILGPIEYFRIKQALPIEFEYPLTDQNLWGIQLFQYLISGLGEEPLFRGFVMVYLAKNWNKVYNLSKIELPITVLLATALFMFAHINIDFATLTISGFDFDQQMKALQMGLLYGLSFHYTRSLLAPIVMHGLSNGIQYTLMFYMAG